MKVPVTETTKAYHNVFNSPEGQIVLKDLSKRCPLLRNTISTVGGIDTNRLIFYEGQRSVLLHIYRRLKMDPYEERQSHALNEESTYAG